MIVVKIDIHPLGLPPQRPEHHVAKLIIWNDGTGTHNIGNYEALLLTGDAPDHPSQLRDDDRVIAYARVESFERFSDQSHIANLVREVLNEIGPVGLPGVRA